MKSADLAQNAAILAHQMAEALAYDPKSTVKPSNIEGTAEALKPMVLHVTNNEPWYQSRVTLGAILSLIAGGAAALGYTLETDLQKNLIEGIIAVTTAAGLLIGPLTVLWGRWVARKPLGS